MHPIAVLQVGHEALLDEVTDPTPAELSSLRDEVLRLARMVDDLQTLAAAEAATLHLARRRADLADVAGARPAAWPAGSRLPTSPCTGSCPPLRSSATPAGCNRSSPTC